MATTNRQLEISCYLNRYDAVPCATIRVCVGLLSHCCSIPRVRVTGSNSSDRGRAIIKTKRTNVLEGAGQKHNFDV